MLQSSSDQDYIKTVRSKRRADAVHPLVIYQVVGDGEIDFFQVPIDCRKERNLWTNKKPPQRRGFLGYVMSYCCTPCMLFCIFSWSPLIFFFLNNAASNFPNLSAKFKRKNCWSRVRMACCVKSADSVYTSDFLVRKMSLTLSVREATLFFMNSYLKAASTPPVGFA